MEPLKFKTNIKCSGCVAQVTPELNKAAGENNWQVDLGSPDRVLTIDGSKDQELIRKAVQNAGFKAEPMA